MNASTNTRAMTSRQRLQAILQGRPVDRIPLTTWCFGLPAPPHLRWRRDGRDVTHWYSLRMEHLHTLAQPWTLEDDFARVRAWQSLGVDDVLDVSIPWGRHPAVTWRDSKLPSGQADRYPVLVREYDTPAGPLRHAVRQTGEDPGPGWPIQPDCVPLLEDYNIPRGVQHAVSSPADVPAIAHLYAPPGPAEQQWLAERMRHIRPFADEAGVFTQAWSAFGMDAVVWFTGTEGAVMMALDEPAAFGRLCEIITAADVARTELAAAAPGIDMVVMRGWYSATDFWSPRLFDEYVAGMVRAVADAAHRRGKPLAYVMTTGVETLGRRLADAGVDLLYFVDPVMDGVSLEWARDHLADRLVLVGGANAVSLGGDPARIQREASDALRILGPTGRFILHPVDAVFPDTPWAGLEQLIAAWRAATGQ